MKIATTVIDLDKDSLVRTIETNLMGVEKIFWSNVVVECINNFFRELYLQREYKNYFISYFIRDGYLEEFHKERKSTRCLFIIEDLWS